MSKNHDEEMVTKGAVKEIVRKNFCIPMGDPIEPVIEQINKLPAVKIKSPAQIERAIFDVIDRQKRMNINGFGYIERHSLIISIKKVLREEIFGKESGKSAIKD